MDSQSIHLRYTGEQYVDSELINFAGDGKVVPYINCEHTSLILLISAEDENGTVVTKEPEYKVQIYPNLSQERAMETSELFVADGKSYIVRAYIGRKGFADITLVNNTAI